MEFAEACRATGLQAVVLPSSEKKGLSRMYLEQVREDWFNTVSGEGQGFRHASDIYAFVRGLCYD